MPVKRRYPLHQSPLYKLSSKKSLSLILGLSLTDLTSITTSNNYHIFKNKKGREIQEPIGLLRVVHERLAKLLARIEVPAYVQSTKGNSYVSNAKCHAGNIPLIKTDIAQFYPTTMFPAIYHLFHSLFCCAADVAWYLARLCCVQGMHLHLPTGSPLSGAIAYFASKPMFDELYSLARQHSCVMTCYVDDIVFSGNKASKSLLVKVEQIIARHGRRVKKDKSKCFAAQTPKIVTGIVICGTEIRLPNERHRKIWVARRKLKDTIDPLEAHNLAAELRGRLQEARQINKVTT